MQGDERMIRDVQTLVQPPEEVLGAVLGILGPRPGSEVLVLLPYPLLLMATDNHALAVGASLLVFVAIQLLRRYAIVVRTDSRVLLAHNGRRRRLHPSATVESLARTAIVLDAAGRNRATVGGHTFWLTGPHVDEARRLASLPAR